MSDVGECGSCRAPVVWTITPAGKRAPVDRDPVADGNTLLLRQSRLGVLSVVLSDKGLELARRGGVALRKNHWATCKDRDEWRAKTDAKKDEAGGDGPG